MALFLRWVAADMRDSASGTVLPSKTPLAMVATLEVKSMIEQRMSTAVER
jgi:hypothetical protein